MYDSNVIIDVNGKNEQAISAMFSKVFGWMFGGLAITGITAYLTASTPWLLQRIFTNNIYLIGLLIAELVLVIALSARIYKMSKTSAITMFILYSIVNGLTLSSIFIVYTLSSISSVFFIAAAMFGVAAVYGHTTKKDLTKIGSILLMGLVGLIIASIVNIFWLNDTFTFIVSAIGVVLFVGLTAYDIQKIKFMASNMDTEIENQDEFMTKFAIIGALMLYLDFINLFLKLLRLLGRSRD